MWWKISLALIVGLVLGLVVSILSFRQMCAYVFEWQTREIAPWSSANKDWREFSIFLRYGGRESLLGEVSLRLELSPE